MSLVYQFWSDLAAVSSGETVPLLLVHGLFGQGVNWAGFARRWAQYRTVMALELPGHGSPGEADDLEYCSMADRLAADLAERSITKVRVLGHSMGGKLAMALALRYPKLVEGLVVVDIAPKVYANRHDDVLAALRAIDPAVIKSRSDAVAVMARYISDLGVTGFLAKSLLPPAGEGEQWRWRFNLPALLEGYHQVGAWPQGLAGTYPGPTVLIRGECSDYVLPEDEALMRCYFPTLQMRTVAGAGHWVQAEQAEGFLAALGDFVTAPGLVPQ